jgi:hypothetical protein
VIPILYASGRNLRFYEIAKNIHPRARKQTLLIHRKEKPLLGFLILVTVRLKKEQEMKIPH